MRPLRLLLDGFGCYRRPAEADFSDVDFFALLGPFFPDGNQNYWKSTLQRELSDDAITAIVEHANFPAFLHQ